MDTGTTAFMLCCIIGLTIMIPGLALFYGGLVSVKSSINMIMMTFGAVAIVGVLWVLFGFSMTFGTSHGGFVGSLSEFAGMQNMLDPVTTINGLPLSLFSLFQALFAALTVAIVSGVAADRMKFSAWMVFAAVWAVVVYFPVAHWVFAFDGVSTPDATGGWIANKLKAIDFAGGTAVHINAGAAAFALALVLGKSKDWSARKPHNVPLTILGAGLLWAGWYAFNGGSALSAGKPAAIVMVTTFTATCAATLAWLAVERLKDGHVTGTGAAAGAITGLVAITPACGAVTPIGAIFVGAIPALICPLAVGLKRLLWRWHRPARQASRGRRLGARLLLHAGVHHRLRDQEDDGHPHLPRGRGDRHRRQTPSRSGLRTRLRGAPRSEQAVRTTTGRPARSGSGPLCAPRTRNWLRSRKPQRR